jgi:hypothetical protein
LRVLGGRLGLSGERPVQLRRKPGGGQGRPVSAGKLEVWPYFQLCRGT